MTHTRARECHHNWEAQSLQSLSSASEAPDLRFCRATQGATEAVRSLVPLPQQIRHPRGSTQQGKNAPRLRNFGRFGRYRRCFRPLARRRRVLAIGRSGWCAAPQNDERGVRRGGEEAPHLGTHGHRHCPAPVPAVAFGREPWRDVGGRVYRASPGGVGPSAEPGWEWVSDVHTGNSCARPSEESATVRPAGDRAAAHDDPGALTSTGPGMISESSCSGSIVML